MRKILIIFTFFITGLQATAGSDELIAELELLLKRKIIGTRELRKMQGSLLWGELVNPVELGVGPEPETLAAYNDVMEHLEYGDVDHPPLRAWLNATILKREGHRHEEIESVLNYIRPCSQPLYPFAIIRLAAAKNLPRLMRAGLGAVGFHDALSLTERVMVTSCSDTAVVLPCVFLGVDGARRVARAMKSESRVCKEIDLGNGCQFKFRVMGLYDGLMPCNIDERISLFEQGRVAMNHYISCAPGGPDEFDNKQLPQLTAALLEECAGVEERKQAAEMLVFNTWPAFNGPVVDKLRAEVARNAAELSGKKSFLYVIYAKIPNPYRIKHRFIQHAFLIEQRLVDGKEQFVLYQSWVNQATCIDNMKRQYSANDEIWNLKRFDEFLVDLEKAYCEKMDSKSLYKCFGYGERERLTPLLTYGDGRLHGVALAFLSAAFNPEDAVKHLGELMNCGFNL